MPIYCKQWPTQLTIGSDIVMMNSPMQDEWPSLCQAAGYILGDDPNVPFRISKEKLSDAMRSAGLYAQFRGYLAADPDRLDRWNDAVVLDSDNPMVLEAIPAIQSLLPEVDINALLRSCTSDL